MEALTALPYVDTLFKEYLLFRGFTQTLQAYTAEVAADRGCGFQADQISELVFRMIIPSHKGDELMELLDFLNTRIYCRLDAELEPAIRRLQVAVLRLFVIRALDAGRAEAVKQFYERHGSTLMSGPDSAEWATWFALPYLRSPSADARFQVYFSKEWAALTEASFRNFLAEAVQQLPLPAILRFDADRRLRVDLQKRVETLSTDIVCLNKRLAAAQQQAQQGGGSGHSGRGPWHEGVTSAAALAQGAPFEQSEPSRQSQSHPPVNSAATPSALQGTAAVNDVVGQWRPSGDAAPIPTAPVRESLARPLGPGGVRGNLDPAAAQGRPMAASVPQEAALPRRFPGAQQDAVVQQEWLAGHEAPITACSFSPGGRNMASASSDGVVRVWAPSSVASDASRTAVQLCGAPVSCLAWDARADKVMLVGMRGRGIKAWHLDTKRMVSQVGLDPPFTDVADLACSPADPTFVCAAGTPKGGASGSGRLSLWNMRSFKKVHTFGIPGDPAISSLGFSPDGRLLVAGGVDGAVRLFDAAGKSVVSTWAVGSEARGPICVRYGPDGRRVWTLGPDGVLRQWDIAALAVPLTSLDSSAFCPAYGASYHHRFAMNAAGRAFAFTSVGLEVPLVCLGLSGGDQGLPEEMPGFVGGGVHGGAVTAVDWHPEGDVIVSGSADHEVCITQLMIP